MTNYMREVAREVEERNIKFKDFIKNGAKNEKKKEFIPRF